MKIVDKYTDQCNDPQGKGFYFLITNHIISEDFLKQPIEKLAAVNSTLSPFWFAYPPKRLFPCHTPESTILSYSYYQLGKSHWSPEEQQIILNKFNKFATHYNISDVLAEIERRFSIICSPVEKRAFYLVEYVDNSGVCHRFYPVSNESDWYKAASYLHNNRNRMPYAVRKQYATNLLNLTSTLDIDSEQGAKWVDFLEPVAGFGTTTSEEYAKLAYERVKASLGIGKLNSDQEVLLKLASEVLKDPSLVRSASFLHDTAELIDYFDKTYKINPGTNGLPFPEDVLFGLTYRKLAKIASEYFSLTSGSVYKVSDLSKIPLHVIAERFGDDMAKEITLDGREIDPVKAAEVLSTLPLPDAQVLDELASIYGVKPVRKYASAGFKLENSLWRTLSKAAAMNFNH